MKTNVYVVYDAKANVYGTPFFFQNDNLAMRAFGQLANDPATTVNRFPADFSLFRVGEFDDSSAHIRAETPSSICNAAGLKNDAVAFGDERDFKKLTDAFVKMSDAMSAMKVSLETDSARVKALTKKKGFLSMFNGRNS